MRPLEHDHALDLALLKADIAYHQLRILLLVAAVSSRPGHARKLDGLTKLAKLDFLVRYPALAPVILDDLDRNAPELHLSDGDRARPTDVDSPMVRYKYGPWDDRYYPVVGALVGRGLLRYTRGRRGSIALATTSNGRELAAALAASPEWAELYDRASLIAEASEGLTGADLKNRIYERLPSLMDRQQRQVI